MKMTGRFGSVASRALAMVAASWLAACASPPKGYAPGPEAAADWDATVEKHIPDAERAAKLKDLGRQMLALQQSMAEGASALSEKAIALNSNYASTKDEARKLLGEYEARHKELFVRYRDIVFAMRSQVSAKEWKALNK